MPGIILRACSNIGAAIQILFNMTTSPLNPEINPLAGINWADILDTLEEQKCALFIGAGAYHAPDGSDIEAALGEWLDVKNPDHPFIYLYNLDGFFLFKKRRFATKVIKGMKEFYNQVFPQTEAQFRQIAQIPFSMIFTLTPDNILSRVFDTVGFDYQLDFYFRNRKASEFYERPTKEKPLIYNLLGNIEEPESLVITHGAFFDYLESVFKANSMNSRLKEELEGMHRYIFLGLPYEKWYFQLLLRVLSMHSEKLQEVERLALKIFEDPRLRILYHKEFKIEFVPASTEQFISELYRQCNDRNMLKLIPESDPVTAGLPDVSLPDLRELIAQGETENAIFLFKVYLDRRRPGTGLLANELIVLQNQLNLLRQRERRETIDLRDSRVENNQIVERLLNIIDRASKL